MIHRREVVLVSKIRTRPVNAPGAADNVGVPATVLPYQADSSGRCVSVRSPSSQASSTNTAAGSDEASANESKAFPTILIALESMRE